MDFTTNDGETAVAKTNGETVEVIETDEVLPPPEVADREQVDRYVHKWRERNPLQAAQRSNRQLPADESPYAKQDEPIDARTPKHKAEFPWLYDPHRGVRWDFDPIELRNLAQGNTWVGMLVQSIVKEIAETPWTIVEADDQLETQKRLRTHPENRDPIDKQEPDRTAERIADLLQDPNPDHGWHEFVEMGMADLLEVGSVSVTKAFPTSAYGGDDGETLIAEPENVRPRALQVSAPEVWTKEYQGKTGLLEGFWQFEDHTAPGSGGSGRAGQRGVHNPTFFNDVEVMWDDMSPRSNRRYGMPPTLSVRDFLRSLDLAVHQEQEYLSRGSIPSGAWVFEQWDREEVKEWKEENEENVKGKPHKSLMFAGQGGDVRFEPMSMNFQELEFTERMQYYAKVVSSMFQVPTAVVGLEPEKINYNTFQGERENFESNTLGPYLQKWERFINDEFIRPHWGTQSYRFEFQPGMSETTRKMISERVRNEVKDGLRTPNEGRREIGLEPSDEEGAETLGTVEGADDGGGPFDELAQAIDKANGMAVEFPNAGGPAFERRTTLIEFCDDLAEVCDGGVFVGEYEYPDQLTGDLDGQPVRGVGINERKAYAVWSRYRDEAVALSDPHTVDSTSEVQKDDDALRNTDEWWQFDVQPHMVESLHEDIADDVRALFEAVLDDSEFQATIERLATDETEKSISALVRRLREVISETDVTARIEQAISEHTASAARETVAAAIEDADADPDIDVDAIEAQLSDREVAFSEGFVNEMADDIRSTVGDGWAEGKNSREIAQDIAEQADINEGWTGAERIARQELQIATGEARSEVAGQLDKVEVWDTAGDDRVRDAHQEMDGTWKRPGENWTVEYERRGVQKESVPGDSTAGIGCRCVTLLRDIEDVDRGDYAGDSGLN